MAEEIGQNLRAITEFGVHCGTVDAGDGYGVREEELDDVIEEIGVDSGELNEERGTRGFVEFGGLVKGGFDLMVAFWRHELSPLYRAESVKT